VRAPHRHPNSLPRHRPHPALRGQNPPLTPYEKYRHVRSPGVGRVESDASGGRVVPADHKVRCANPRM
jgi:hypothetical protein